MFASFPFDTATGLALLQVQVQELRRQHAAANAKVIALEEERCNHRKFEAVHRLFGTLPLAKLHEEMATQKDCPSSPRVDVPTLPFLEFVEPHGCQAGCAGTSQLALAVCSTKRLRPPPGLAGPADFDWQNVQAAQREEQEDLEAEAECP